MCELTGISRGTYLRLDRGDNKNPRIRLLANCAKVLGDELVALIEPEWKDWFRADSGYPAEPDDPSVYWRDEEAARGRLERELLADLTSDERPSTSGSP